MHTHSYHHVFDETYMNEGDRGLFRYIPWDIRHASPSLGRADISLERTSHESRHVAGSFLSDRSRNEVTIEP